MKKQYVFLASLVIVLVIIATGIYSATLLDDISTLLYENIIEHAGWAYLLAAFIFLVFAIVLAFSRYGYIKLGKDYEKPQYSYFGWFSMLFAAGMGIGLIFWGVAEPLVHYLEPPAHIQAATGEAASFSMRYSFFHWGLQPWGIYIVMSLSIAYFSFRRDMPPLISSSFYPIIGEKIYGFWGYFIDVLAVFATIFGIATSLGLGAKQIHSGLTQVYGIPDELYITFIIIAVATVLFMISTFVGLDRGIQTLSKTNLMIAGLLLLFMLIAGPTSYVFNVFTSTLGQFTNRFLEMSLEANPFNGYEWIRSWTLFYWAWWISWSPFVGMFVARISRGRTIREFVVAVLTVPTLLTFFWFSVFGGSSLHLQMWQGVDVAGVATEDSSRALFAVFEHFPLSDLLSLVAILLLFVFFVTSADSATFVLGIMTSNGSLSPPLYKRVTWGIIQSSVAVILLFIGGLLALQQMSLIAALPFTFVMLMMCYSLILALSEEKDDLV